MRWRIILIGGAAIAAAAAGALVYAQLSSTQTASGTVSVTTTSADLYICEPRPVGPTPPSEFGVPPAGPECVSDDSGADETVFEGLENIRPGQVREWDIRLRNVGSEDWIVTGVTLNIVETADPGNDCPDNALQAGRLRRFDGLISSTAGVFILGKVVRGFDVEFTYDSRNNNPPEGLEGIPAFLGLEFEFAFGFRENRHIIVEPIPSPSPSPPPNGTPTPTATPAFGESGSGYEDVRLGIELQPTGTDNCDGNEWDVSWQFTVS